MALAMMNAHIAKADEKETKKTRTPTSKEESKALSNAATSRETKKTNHASPPNQRTHSKGKDTATWEEERLKGTEGKGRDEKGEMRQDQTRQDRTRQDKTRRDKIGHDKTRPDKTGQTDQQDPRRLDSQNRDQPPKLAKHPAPRPFLKNAGMDLDASVVMLSGGLP